jgi:hypothetical protein
VGAFVVLVVGPAVPGAKVEVDWGEVVGWGEAGTSVVAKGAEVADGVELGTRVGVVGAPV